MLFVFPLQFKSEVNFRSKCIKEENLIGIKRLKAVLDPVVISYLNLFIFK